MQEPQLANATRDEKMNGWSIEDGIFLWFILQTVIIFWELERIRRTIEAKQKNEEMKE